MSLRDPLDQAFRDGLAGRRQGLDRSQCPYALSPGSLDLIVCHPAIRRAWMRGWQHEDVRSAQDDADVDYVPDPDPTARLVHRKVT